MFNSFREIAKVISTNIPELVWIDRDKGQLDSPENFHSVQIPGLLLDFSTVNWESLLGGNQRGICTLTAKLIFRLPVSTYEGADWNDYPEFEHLSDTLHEQLSDLKSVGLRRVSRDYFTKNYFVTEQSYDFTLYHTKQGKTIKKPNPAIQGSIHTTITIQ